MSSLPPETPAAEAGAPPPPFVEFALIERREEDFAGATGHDEMFLGVKVAFPLPTAEVKRVIAKAKDGSDKLHYRHFTLQMNRKRRMPMWTMVDIDGSLKAPHGGRPGWSYDPRMDSALQTDDKVFSPGASRVAALDRGHMVRQLDPVWGDAETAKQAQHHTFCLTNVCPQLHNFNDHEWGDLEDHVLDAVQNAGARAVVVTGPVFRFDDPLIADLLRGGPREDVPMPEIRVPRRFYKIIAWRDEDSGALKAAGFIRDQSDELTDAGPIRDMLGDLVFAVPVSGDALARKIEIQDVQTRIEDIETMVGLEFPGLAEADTLAAAGLDRQVLASPQDAIL